MHKRHINPHLCPSGSEIFLVETISFLSPIKFLSGPPPRMEWAGSKEYRQEAL